MLLLNQVLEAFKHIEESVINLLIPLATHPAM